MVHCYYCFTIIHIVNITGMVHVFFTLSSSLSYFVMYSAFGANDQG